jgi:hypothetical protein
MGELFTWEAMRPAVAWLAQIIVGIFVLLNIIPKDTSGQLTSYLADGITYLVMAGTTFYYMKHQIDIHKTKIINNSLPKTVVVPSVNPSPSPIVNIPLGSAEIAVPSQEVAIPNSLENSGGTQVFTPASQQAVITE